MGPQLTKHLQQLRALYGRLDARSKVITGLMLLAAVGGLAYLASGDHSQYATLFSGLSMEDASKITEELKASKVPFKLQAGGTSILVPEAEVHELRLSMAGQGLPRGGGVGFEIFDDQKFGASDFAQQINYRRALQGELERTIGQIDVVQAARVHVAMPRRELFARKKRPVSASVTLRLHPGRTLSRAQVKGVVHLVSSSIVDLSAEHVAVVDTSGNMLWGGQETEGLAANSGALEYKHNLESVLEQRVADIVHAAFGSGRAVVKVTTEVGMSEVEQTVEEYDPEKSVVRSESSVEEKSGAGTKQAAGIPGVQGNLPGGPSAGSVSGGAGSTRKQVTRNYEVNRVVRRKVSPAGELHRLSVAVLVDKGALADVPAGREGDEGTEGDKAKEASEEASVAGQAKLKDLEQVICQAVGCSAARGDTVTVRAVDFAGSPKVTPERTPLYLRIMQDRSNWVTAAILLGVIVVLVALLRRWRQVGEQLEVLSLPRTVKELESAMGGGEGNPKALGEGEASQRGLAQDVAGQDSARAAQVLRAWMTGS